MDYVWHKHKSHHPLMLHWTGEECLRSSSGSHLHTPPGYKKTLGIFIFHFHIFFGFIYIYLRFYAYYKRLSEISSFWGSFSTYVHMYLNLSSAMEHCSIFEPGDVCRRWTFSRYTLKENSCSLSHGLVLRAVENIFQTWKWEFKIGCPLLNLEDHDGNINVDWAWFSNRKINSPENPK